MAEQSKPYEGLTPDAVLDALDSTGLRGDGRLLALNSYENRVYQVSLEDGGHCVVKFYRPARWSEAQILEEHAFAAELASREIPVIAPQSLEGRTLHAFGAFRFAVYPRRGGRTPELEDDKVMEWIGRFLGRIHAVGATEPFRERPLLDTETFGGESIDWLLESGMIPEELYDVWQSTAELALETAEDMFDAQSQLRAIRLHGDCHVGNILWTEEGPHFVDLDDARMGPPAQDLWMLLAGDRETATRQLKALLSGYERFYAFPREELRLIEPLRTLRLLYYSAWLGRRWGDPAFPAAFPWFGTTRYWQEKILELREQTSAMKEPPLSV